MIRAAECWELLCRVRKRAPLVQCITNFVAMETAANVLLAAGASPAMTHAAEEAAEFATLADALTINIGTLTPGWIPGMREAARAFTQLGKPWVLDPVGAGATSLRRRTAAELLALRPAIVRGNASEVIALCGHVEARQKGVDSTQSALDARASAQSLAQSSGCVVVVSGAIDLVTDGVRVVRIANGHHWMTRVTALGCALTALTGAFAAVEKAPIQAAIAASAIFALAGEIAARSAAGPGSLHVALLDSLYGMDEATLAGGLRIA